MIITKGPRDFYKLMYVPVRAVKFLQYSVPDTHRYFEDHAWFVHEKYLEDIKSLCDNTRADTTPSVSDDYSILHLRRTAPMVIVEAAWRALAKIHHPDRGGDPEEFKRISAAYERIKDGADE